MYIKDQIFNDEDTLLEMLFDFSLGEATQLIKNLQQTIEKDLQEKEAYKAYHASLTDEEDRVELETEERTIRLAEALMEQFEKFEVKQRRLYGIKAKERILLYEIDLV